MRYILNYRFILTNTFRSVRYYLDFSFNSIYCIFSEIVRGVMTVNSLLFIDIFSLLKSGIDRNEGRKEKWRKEFLQEL